MPDNIFIDSNILVYAHDLDAGSRHETARMRIREVWNDRLSVFISVQVLQEVFASLMRNHIEMETAMDIVRNYSHWPVIDNTVPLMEHGMQEMKRWQLSFWDGMILAAARQAGANTLWSEDFNTGQDYGGIVAINPLQDATS